MSQANIMNTKPKKFTLQQSSTNNGQSNNALPPNRRNLQNRIISNVNKTYYPNTRMRTCQTARHHR
jgi:hypothetical protein